MMMMQKFLKPGIQQNWKRNFKMSDGTFVGWLIFGCFFGGTILTTIFWLLVKKVKGVLK